MNVKLTRRILAVVLTIAMVLTLIPAAFASDFSDVPSGAWYEAAVDYCAEEGLMAGTTNGFSPNGKVTREMAVQTLYSMAGKPEVSYEAKFSDVPEGMWYTDAIIWAVANGITSGTGNGKFGVGINVTREQIATFFYKYAVCAGMEEDFASLKSYPDNDTVSAWAVTAMQWAVKFGVISGKLVDDTAYLKPLDQLTRAELAAMLKSFHPQVPPLCAHTYEIVGAKEATCTEPGYSGDKQCSVCGFVIEKGQVIPALGHDFVDGFCSRCGAVDPDHAREFVLVDELTAGSQVVIYNPGHEMVIKNENDNDWYLIPESIQPTDDKFVEAEPGALNDYVWTVVDNGDGSVSFYNGDNAIVAWVSGTYIELTNNAEYPDSDKNWEVISAGENNLFFIKSQTISNSYGPAYIECYYNANKDQTKISGYTSSNPAGSLNDYGFQFYSFGLECDHEWDEGETVPATCTEDGYTLYTCTKCGATEKQDVVAATGHDYVDGTCSVCGAVQDAYVLVDAIADGDEVVIFNPGHSMAIKNETDNNWYLVPETITPDGEVINDPDASLVWTVVDNGDGTVSFVNGENAIAAWVSGTYIELTNDANYAGADIKWIVTFTDGLAYIQSSTLSNSYGPAYIECYYNANKDKTNIAGYTSSNPTANSNDFGFQFYAKGSACAHDWVAGTPVAPTCTEEGYTTYTCSICGATKDADKVPALGHNDENGDGVCDVCDTPIDGFALTDTIKNGDEVVIYSPGHGMAIKNETDNNWYLVPVEVTPANSKIANPDASIVWTVVDNGDGTFSFVNGENAIAAWVNSTYIELTNDANYAGADIKWIVTFNNGLAYIQSSTLSNSYGPAYIECYYNANKDKTNIAGYTSSDPTANPNDFGFEFYVRGGEICNHAWEATSTTDATCTEAGEINYSCTLCGDTRVETIPALGHVDEDEDGVCDRCEDTIQQYTLTTSLVDGDQVIIYYPVSGVAMADTLSSNKVASVPATVSGDKLDYADGMGVFTVAYVDANNFTLQLPDGTYLTSAETGNGMSFETTANACSQWTLEAVADSDKVYIKNIGANHNGNYNQALEFYTNAFTTYGIKETEIYQFQLFAIAGCEHEWTDGSEVAATCTEGAYVVSTCSLCGVSKTTETAAALGHDWVADTANNVAPTCIEAGVNAFACSRCSETKTEIGEPATGHNDDDADDICDVCGKDLAEAGYTVADSIAVGDKIIIVAAHDSKYYATVGVLGSTDTKVNNALSAREVVLDGNAIADTYVDTSAIVWEVVAGDAVGTYKLKASDGKYMAHGTSGTLLKTADTGASFAITCGNGTASLMAVAEGMTNRGVCFRNNAGVPQFRLYSSASTSADYSWALTIFKLG